ncbi:MAG: hypothetical protein AB8H80_04460 [Planctomycetota bacterium]
MGEHRVFLIFGELGEDLWSLSRECHVWLMSSPGNDAAAERVWSRDDEPYTPECGVTTFRCDDDSPAELLRMLVTVDQHHDEHSVDVPWSAIHVRGFQLSGISAAEVANELGMPCQVLPEDGGLAIIRQPN